jgi:hypothetical protein
MACIGFGVRHGACDSKGEREILKDLPCYRTDGFTSVTGVSTVSAVCSGRHKTHVLNLPSSKVQVTFDCVPSVQRNTSGCASLGRLLFTQRLGQRYHVQQRHTFVQLGIEHHRAVHIANWPIRRPLQDLHGAVEMQQQPKHQTRPHKSHTLPTVILVRCHQSGCHQGGDDEFFEHW